MEVRPVDDDPVPELAVIRLGSEPQPVRLIPEAPTAHHRLVERLEIPAVAAMDSRRTHEPGPELLRVPEPAAPVTGEDAWGRVSAQREPVPWGWFALLGLLLTGAVIWSVTHVQEAEPLVAGAHQEAVQAANQSAEKDREMERLLQRMEATVKAYCEATSLQALLPMVRHPARVHPLMEQYYAQHPFKPLGFARVATIRGTEMDSKRNFWELPVVLGDGNTKEFVLEETEDGSLLVDWEAAVIYQPMPWDDYAKQRAPGSPMDFRLVVEEDHFYSHEFTDSNRWASFRLTTRNGEETLFGYTPRGGQVATTLLALIGKSATPQAAVILQLKVPPDVQSRRGVLIEKVLSPRWIYEDPPDSGS